MDAKALSFANESFDNVTFFYSLMYMSTEVKAKAIAEACRVLKNGGKLIIWDSVITSAYPKVFLAELDIEFSGETVHTEYGILEIKVEQNEDMIIKMCSKSGVRLFEHERYSEGLSLNLLSKYGARIMS